MKIEQIFREFERGLENEYYVELAKEEVISFMEFSHFSFTKTVE